MSRQRHPAHRTQWAAQFAVASELCKREYQVALTVGNHPVLDLMVVSPTGTQFLVDVKGLHRSNPWLIKRKPLNADLYYVLAYVPKDKQNQFFVMSQVEAHALIEEELRRLGRPNTYPVTGFDWGLALPHEDAWHVLPA